MSGWRRREAARLSRWAWYLAALAVALVVWGTPAGTADQVLVPANATWKYNDSGANLGTSWRAAAFNDAAWLSGSAELGYGDGDEATILSYGPNASNRRITYYFRRAFTVATPSQVEALTLRYVRDDGCVIYLNGVEVVRSNMPAGTVTSSTRATTAIGGADESTWLQASVDPALLAAGTNVLAVEIHQQSPTSTDISFNLELRAATAAAAAPAVTLTSPATHAVANGQTVTFAAAASAPDGLVSATLLVGGPEHTAAFSGAAVEDAQIVADTPTAADGAGSSINVDGASPHAHGLLKVPTLIGADGLPAGATIVSAALRLTCTNAGNVMRLYRLTEDWVEDQATWNERATGVPWRSPGADGALSNAGLATTGDCTVTGERSIDVTAFVREWSSGAPNYGVVIVEGGTDGVDFSSSESGLSPVLTVTYRSPLQAIETKPLAGTSAVVSFQATLPIAETYWWNVRIADAGGRQASAPADFDLTIDAAAPDEPILVAPAAASTGVSTSPTLSASVSDPAGGELAVSIAIRPAAAPEFTIVALPDTQHYSETFPAIFTAQTQWIVDNRAARNIVFVTHEGDIVQNAGLDPEWTRAVTSMNVLHGQVPYGMGPGNHDQPTTKYNQYFPFTRYQGLPWYGGHQGTLNDNNYQLFSGGGLDFVIVHLTFCPPAAAVTWADSVFKTYANRVGIMTTHGYLGLNAVRNVHVCGDTQYLWDGLATGNPNLRFMLSGHVHGESRRVDVVNGRTVFQMLADYQDLPSGGEGWLRILRFVPGDDRVYVQTYSPWLNRYQNDADSEFTLDFPMGGAWSAGPSALAPSGSTAAVALAGLLPNTAYEWRMTVTNGSGRSRTGPVWNFTTGTGGSVNQPPVAADRQVSAAEDTPAAIQLTATDADGGALTFGVVDGPSHGTLAGNPPSLTYQPAANYNGPDGFTFRANDGTSSSNTASVSISVLPVNDAPSAAPDTYGVQGGSSLAVSAPGVLGNDVDVDGPSLSAALVTGPVSGTLSLTAGGSFTYTPAPGFSGTDSFTYRATDGALSSGAVVATIQVSAPPPNPAPAGLVAAFNFNEGTGTTATDRSGRGHTGTIAGAAWSAAGKYGGALSFDGVNDWVTVSSTAALTLTTGMTIEAWVNASATSGWRTVALKERPAGLAYGLYAANSAGRAAGYINTGTDIDVNATAALPLNTWTHLAITYDGAMLRIFVNGAQVAARAQSGALSASSGALRIGGNGVWGEFFQGRIDEVRIYNRALTAAEILADLAAPITP